MACAGGAEQVEAMQSEINDGWRSGWKLDEKEEEEKEVAAAE